MLTRVMHLLWAQNVCLDGEVVFLCRLLDQSLILFQQSMLEILKAFKYHYDAQDDCISEREVNVMVGLGYIGAKASKSPITKEKYFQ